MSFRVVHLDKGPKGMAAITACGRNILRTPISTDWAGFTATAVAQRCEKCNASKQAALLARKSAAQTTK